MAAIPTNFGEGGTGLSPRGNGLPGIATVLRDIAADLAAILGDAPAAIPSLADPSAVTTGAPAAVGAPSAVGTAAPAALGAFSDGPSAGEMATLRTAFNTLNTRVTEIAARLDGAVAAVAALNTLNTRVTEVLARLNGVSTNLGSLGEVIEDLHTIQSDRADATLLTTAP